MTKTREELKEALCYCLQYDNECARCPYADTPGDDGSCSTLLIDALECIQTLEEEAGKCC